MGRYRVLSTLGKGGQAIVREAIDNETGESVALKIFKKCDMNFFGLNAAQFEYSVMGSLLDHDNILKTKCYFEDCDFIIIAQELMSSDLRSMLTELGAMLTENQIKNIFH